MTNKISGLGNIITHYKNRAIDYLKPVKVYRNLHSKTEHDKYSIQQAGLIVAHTSQILLTGCHFLINKAGQNRVRKEHRKNVHAFIRGTIALQGAMGTTAAECPRGLGCKITYNPYKNNTFVCVGLISIKELPLSGAGAIMINEAGVTGAYLEIYTAAKLNGCR